MHSITEVSDAVNWDLVGSTFVNGGMLPCGLNGVVCCSLEFDILLCNSMKVLN